MTTVVVTVLAALGVCVVVAFGVAQLIAYGREEDDR